jgi:hypothetical protein
MMASAMAARVSASLASSTVKKPLELVEADAHGQLGQTSPAASEERHSASTAAALPWSAVTRCLRNRGNSTPSSAMGSRIVQKGERGPAATCVATALHEVVASVESS